MGFWSKAILTKNLHKKSTKTTTTTATKETETQHKNQRQCPRLQEEKQQKQSQQQKKEKPEENCKIHQKQKQQQQQQQERQSSESTLNQNPHPPPPFFPLKAKPRKTKPRSEEEGNHQKSKHKVQRKSQIPSKKPTESESATTKTKTICCCTKIQQQQQLHQHQHQCQKHQKQDCTLRKFEVAYDIRNLLKFNGKILYKLRKALQTLPWICIPFLLSMTCCASSPYFPAAKAQSYFTPSSSLTSAITVTTTKATAAIAPLAAYATLAATMASVSGVAAAAAAAAYANGATIYETKPLELNANEAEINNGMEEGEPGEELMYAYYKRAQRHQQQMQQRHQQQQQYQHAAVVNSPAISGGGPTEASQEFNFDEIVPTLGMASVLANSKKFTTSRTQKRSDKSTLNTSNKSTSSSSSASASATTTAPTLPTSKTAKPSPSSSPSSSPSASTGSTTPSPDDEKCEPKVLDEVPTEPFYDFSDVAEDAARQFTEFLANKFPSGPPHPKHNISIELRQEITRRAYGIASYALNEDDNLLAFAIAAPNVHTVVLKFRSNVTVPPEQAQNKSFLGSYWRELIYALNSTEGSQEWGAPFRDCNLLKKRWLWPFRVSYAEYKFKIVTAAFIAADEDVCNDGLEDVFGRRHGCDRNTTFCLLTENKPLPPRDVYTCICKESFYLPNSTLQGFSGDVVEMSEGYDNYSCIPCPGGCSHCDQNGECLLLGEPPEVVSMESLMKVTVGTVLGGCILCCFVLSVIVFRQRKSKAIAIGMWTVLETILLGIILLYASVAVHFFPASTERCLLEPWLRELGFVIFYGAIILKLYRHLVDFRTRKAHRWVLRDVDLLKYLGTMVFAVLCYLAGFTASSLDLLQSGQLESLREISTNTCLPLKWDYVTQISEILVLLFGLHLSFASRNANTQFRERQFLVATLVLEFLVSTTFYVLRFIYLQDMSPSTIFLALFVRSQLTNTISLGLIFVPKLWYQHKQV